MQDSYKKVRAEISLLGRLLGETIRAAEGDALFESVEALRKIAKLFRHSQLPDRDSLAEMIHGLPDDALLPIARAFSHFLNFANISEQYHSTTPEAGHQTVQQQVMQSLERLKSQSVPVELLQSTLADLSIELVLTAHPTEITRQTLIYKFLEMRSTLETLDRKELQEEEREQCIERLRQLLAQAWYTNEIRHNRPTPVDEAEWGLSVIENSLWQALPQCMNALHQASLSSINYSLPQAYQPIRFTSWVGGDRDGNPHVTAEVTQRVIARTRWKACQLYLKDIQFLIFELSMQKATPEVYALLNDTAHPEPYRAVLRQVRNRLLSSRDYWLACSEGQTPLKPLDLLESPQDLLHPLSICHASLQRCGMDSIAAGGLNDTLHRIRCFGLSLVRLDIRQDSARHLQVFSELTKYLGVGDYASWTESEKQSFLIRELNSKRPLLPLSWDASDDVKEVIRTCEVIAHSPKGSIAAYVISMAKRPSDILAVYLLLKEAGCEENIPVVPLFETLEDLDNAPSVMSELLAIQWYRGALLGRQMVMIGYSDSAKDAGAMAAGWAQYKAQAALIQLFEEHQIGLTLFHGRGGSIGRGGAPAHAALVSQPPGSLKGGFRVTEQGEMIRFKLGHPSLALDSLGHYASAIIEANAAPPPAPKQEWIDCMEVLSQVSYDAYKEIVRQHPDFIPYFVSATPLGELERLPLGSRPAKRKKTQQVEDLRAIPWIFAWTQNRLMLPAWLGAGASLRYCRSSGSAAILEEMVVQWPFFATRLGMLEMVMSKADAWLSEQYEKRLVPEHLWPLGIRLRKELKDDLQTVVTLRPDAALMSDLPWIAESIALRNIYTDPLNILQVELLDRVRRVEQPSVDLEQALMVTIAGIAAGMRNTG